eukprot:CAMPEP_0113565134 /NCGR_PEP_ID=MMETSP0015_2-20120614/22012_1 /TAXON_ID=2838 /ORGANISM="Odontella" /LENGTH=588 /DNA_ID=CAMNT_0000467305 /DNA_START=292 /DNA_END=2058 /DNA_ORIENTATION=+ /assembly_acc=CAM_ASM_000160
MGTSDSNERPFDEMSEFIITSLPPEATIVREGHVDAIINPYLADDDEDDGEACDDEVSFEEDAISCGGIFADETSGEDRDMTSSDGNGNPPAFSSRSVPLGGNGAAGMGGGERRDEGKIKYLQSVICAGVKYGKYLYSTGLLVFSLTLVFAAMFTDQTTMARDVHPAFAFFFFWFLIMWLAVMEGCQGCIVGLQPVDKALYAKSHPIAHKNTELAHRGDNMERFIAGRQFLVVLVVFLINMCGAPTEGVAVLNMPEIVINIFLDNGVAMIFGTIILGNLTPQINAAVCMLDFINTYFMLFTSYASFAIETSGLLHSVYLVQIVFSKITRKPMESKEPPRTAGQNILFWGRVLLSCVILGFSLTITLTALFDGYSGIWEGVPPVAGIVIFLALLCVVGIMEGMQIAAFALLNVPQEELSQHPIASANCTLVFSGKNLQSFLIGRQIFVATCMFVVARIATVSIPEGEENIFGVSDGFQNLIDTGLLGAIVLTILGSLAWRIIASLFPLAFMSNPAVYLIITTCLFLEKTGLCSAARLLAWIHKKVARFEPDEHYTGRKTEREGAGESKGFEDRQLQEAPTFEDTADFQA